MLVGRVKAPISGLVFVLSGILRNLVLVLNAVKEKNLNEWRCVEMTIDEIVEAIEKLTVSELAELVKSWRTNSV